MQIPKCSVIIPTYNHAEYIERSVRSALAQTYSNVEVIVVDDGSTDDTAERVEKFGDAIIYHKKVNGGLGAARNTGIQLSKGKYLQFLDADDTIEPEKLKRQVALLEADPTTALVYSDCRNTDLDGSVNANISYPLAEGEDPIQVLISRVMTSLNAVLIRRVAVLDVGMFDECRHAQEDWDFWIRLRLKGFEFKYSPGDLVHYDQTGSEMTSDPVLMYRRTRHLLNKFEADPVFQTLDRRTKRDFVAFQNFAMATRSYNCAWWSRSRKHFLRAIIANPRRIEFKYWTRLPLSILRQGYDLIRGRRRSEPPDLDV